MLILRIGRGVIDHFPVRRSEWISACVMIAWGAILTLDGLPLYGSWVYLSVNLTEQAWAALLICLGFVRLIVLTINGSFPTTWYGKWAPHVRVATSLICTLAWLQLVLAGIKAPIWSTGVAAYAGYFVSDMLNTFSGSAEAREIDKGRKDVAARTIDPGELVHNPGDSRRPGGWLRNRLRPQKPDDSQSG